MTNIRYGQVSIIIFGFQKYSICWVIRHLVCVFVFVIVFVFVFLSSYDFWIAFIIRICMVIGVCEAYEQKDIEDVLWARHFNSCCNNFWVYPLRRFVRNVWSTSYFRPPPPRYWVDTSAILEHFLESSWSLLGNYLEITWGLLCIF